MAQARITVDDTRDRIRNGHPWIFGTQIQKEEGEYAPGDIVQVFDKRRRPLGQGYINPASMIRIRLLTPHLEDRINKAFITERIVAAWQYRLRMGHGSSCRVVFGEADGLPGLVVDKFQDVGTKKLVLSVQFLTLGMERWKDVVLEALNATIKPDGVYLRNDVPIREKEGLEQYKGFADKPFDTDLIIDENGLRISVDVAGGQKTGHFLDQVANHAAMQQISSGNRVLDCFTHTGGFGLHAAHYGAKEVYGIDISEDAITQAKRNTALNKLKLSLIHISEPTRPY